MLASARPANAAVSSRLNKRVATAALNANAVITAHASKAKPKGVVIEGAVCLQSITTPQYFFKVIKMYRKILLIISSLGLIAVSGCMSVPNNLNLSLGRTTEQNIYLVEAHSLVTPIDINKMHAWEITVRTPSGEPVSNAHIDVSGGMPQHGHGFPTQPRVTKELGDGRYLLEGMKFSMSGWWEIKMAVSSKLGTDRVTFNKVIEQPALVAIARIQ